MKDDEIGRNYTDRYIYLDLAAMLLHKIDHDHEVCVLWSVYTVHNVDMLAVLAYNVCSHCGPHAVLGHVEFVIYDRCRSVYTMLIVKIGGL